MNNNNNKTEWTRGFNDRSGIPSWLNDIPSEAGGESETRTTPSTFLHRQHTRQTQPQQSQYQWQHQPPAQLSQSQQYQYSPHRQPRQHHNPPSHQLYGETPVMQQFQKPFQQIQQQQTPAPSPIRPRQTRTQSQTLVPQSGGPSPPFDSRDPLTQAREKLFQNFARRCPAHNDTTHLSQLSLQPVSHQSSTPPSSSPEAASSCSRCQLVKEFISQPRHTHKFLTYTLLTISEVFSYEEMLAYLNEHIVSRIVAARQKGMLGQEKTYPVMEDYEKIVGKVRERKEVLEGAFGIGVMGIDRFGMVRDVKPDGPGGSGAGAGLSGSMDIDEGNGRGGGDGEIGARGGRGGSGRYEGSGTEGGRVIW
ncbi:hypothetical protein QBC35DRAFT_122679 [Podospora australis]|uniref:Uncharacterized protein n=1 Tax=Podospora australis TaxID=1536484 RepID=A0AAN6WYY8_9PEZI|nr:hypothetical protein QBC35DRAFT_122679 [Podospora australis]